MARAVTRKKLIEVALPLDTINVASAREKSIRHGHPSTLHLWWARRPLAAARAVIFASLVDDPSAWPQLFPSEEAQSEERQRLFDLIEQLVKWENTTDERVLEEARAEIRKNWRGACADNRAHPRAADLFDPDKLPAFHDPFAGGGSIPLEAQRLGLESFASDLNPVAVLINKAMIEIPPKFAGRLPVNPRVRSEGGGERSEQGRDGDAPSGDDSVAAVDGGGMRAVSSVARREVGMPSQNTARARERTRFLGVTRRDREAADAVRSPTRAPATVRSDGRGESNADSHAPQTPRHLTSHSALLFPLSYRGAAGLAEDVRYYGKWMRAAAEKRIGHLYPKLEVTPEMAQARPDLERYVGRKLTVIAWLWARTVRSSNPAFAAIEAPLASTFILSKKKDREAYVEPLIEDDGYRFTVKAGPPPERARKGTKLARGANFQCVMSGAPMTPDYIKAEGIAGRLGARLMAIVAEGDRGRVYLPPTEEHAAIARQAEPDWKPENDLIGKCRDQLPLYGMNTFADLFTDRQLVALTTFSDLVSEARERIRLDAAAAGLPDDGIPLRDGGVGATAYAEALAVYLAFATSKLANIGSSIATWMSDRGAFRETFARQAIPMVWDYAEANPFTDTGGGLGTALSKSGMAIAAFPASVLGNACQVDASTQALTHAKVVSTDPPYYDNIGYADLSDFFYVWLRRSLRQVFPDIFATLAVPKVEELVATPYRHGSKDKAEAFFLDGMTRALQRLAEQSHPAFPATIYYAFKQSEKKGDFGTSSTGWETFLEAVIRAGLAVSGTWPMRTEGTGRIVAKGANALASSIVLVCRPRPADAPLATRSEFVDALKAELPPAVAKMQTSNIAPVDLAQTAIGPGMAIFSRYARVLSVSGETVSVRDALALINQTLDETLSAQEGDFDTDTRWALAWFEQVGFAEGEFGVAETLSKAKNTSIDGLVAAGILQAGAGKARLLRPLELPVDWEPQTDTRLTVWEVVHHLVRVHYQQGEEAAGVLLARLRGNIRDARELAYRLYHICERKKRAQEAHDYNALVRSWPEIARLAVRATWAAQATLLDT